MLVLTPKDVRYVCIIMLQTRLHFHWRIIMMSLSWATRFQLSLIVVIVEYSSFPSIFKKLFTSLEI